MPIIDNRDGAHVEYSIPPEIKNQIPVYFYIAFAGELFSIYGRERSRGMLYPEVDGGYADLASSTAGWLQAFKATCRKLEMGWLLEYYNALPWYESDVFDGILEQEIRRHLMYGKENGTNEYYRYLCSRDDNGGEAR